MFPSLQPFDPLPGSRFENTSDHPGLADTNRVRMYRIIKGRPYRVLVEGKAVYYENGIAHLDMLIEDEGSAEVELGGWSFLSNNMRSDIIEFPSAKANKAFKENGSLAPLFECVEKLRKKKTEKIRDCVKANL